jgi:phospholipase/carboxylesterase
MGEPAVDAIARLVPAIVRGLHALEFSGRHLSPQSLDELIKALSGRDVEIEQALQAAQEVAWPPQLEAVRDCLVHAATSAKDGITGLQAANQAPQPMLAAYRALRSYATGAAALYPLAAHMRPVSQFFLEARARDDKERLDALASADPDRAGVGVTHFGGPPGTRGGFSLYVPEYYEAGRAWPLVVAMHGGSGNGGAFLWSWLREARSRGVILIAPTARGSTWSLMQPEIDGENIDQMLDEVGSRYTIDPAHKLLTGMSDGGTFTYVLALRGPCRFTHLAPVSAAFHPIMMSWGDPGRVKGVPIHITHGAQDWMFPAETAAMAQHVLAEAGAKATYREVADLSHTYPRDENATMLDWFMETRADETGGSKCA